VGITPLHAELIVREHLRRSLPETVHLAGRQTNLFTFEQTVALLEKLGVELKAAEVELD
jgi:hypothetical protein